MVKYRAPSMRIPREEEVTVTADSSIGATDSSIAATGVPSRDWGMTKQALLSEILRLPPDERIDLLGEAWDAIAASPEDVALPEWHLDELERRLADPEPKYVPWEEVRARLQGCSGDRDAVTPGT